MPDKEEIVNTIVADSNNDTRGVVDGQKYYDEAIYYRPFGGATSFAEVDAQKEAMEYSYSVDVLTDQLRGIIHNITADDDIEAGQKASSISSAAEDYRKRVSSVDKPMGRKSLWNKVKEFLTAEMGKEDSEFQAEYLKGTPRPGRLVVYKDKETGQPRWLGLSANAFEDNEKELFTTKALEEAVEYADKTDERGPLLVQHVPSAEIGHCDFQAVVGRFLVESGTFADTQLGRKALEHYSNSDEEHQVSIGYLHVDGDEKDGQYDWLRIKERSICDPSLIPAANPWTEFQVLGEKEMDAKREAVLEKVFGKDLAAQVISTVEEKSKELEGKIRFKEVAVSATEEGAPDIRIVMENVPEAEASKEETKTEEVKKEETSATGEQTDVAALLTSLIQKVDNLAPTVATLSEEVKELKKTDDEKVAAILTPRITINSGDRPSNSNGNIVDNAKDVIKDNQDLPDNPVKPFIEDLLGRSGARV